MTARLITAADVCEAAETALVAGLLDTITAFGLEDEMTPPATWDQLPTLEALTSANMPAGAITSPGLVGEPVQRSTGYDATWRLVVGVYDRDADHSATADRIRTWAGLLRATIVRARSLGGLAQSVKWSGENYQLLPMRSAARTISGCAVAFNVTVTNVVDVFDLGDLPIVESTHPILTVRPNQE